MNIRYRFKRADELETVEVLSIEEVEDGVVSHRLARGYEILSRDLGTGLRDKNGVEIFERDICENRVGKQLLIYWHVTACAFRQKTIEGNNDFPMNWNLLEIIGRSEEGRE